MRTYGLYALIAVTFALTVTTFSLGLSALCSSVSCTTRKTWQGGRFLTYGPTGQFVEVATVLPAAETFDAVRSERTTTYGIISTGSHQMNMTVTVDRVQDFRTAQFFAPPAIQANTSSREIRFALAPALGNVTAELPRRPSINQPLLVWTWVYNSAQRTASAIFDAATGELALRTTAPLVADPIRLEGPATHVAINSARAYGFESCYLSWHIA